MDKYSGEVAESSVLSFNEGYAAKRDRRSSIWCANVDSNLVNWKVLVPFRV